MKKEITNNLIEAQPIKGVYLPDGRFVTASLAKMLGFSVPPQGVSVPPSRIVSVPLPDGIIQ